jgi:hypothetical protein
MTKRAVYTSSLFPPRNGVVQVQGYGGLGVRALPLSRQTRLVLAMTTATESDGGGSVNPDTELTAQDDKEKESTFLGPVPEIEKSLSLEAAGTPDALLQLREHYLEKRNVTLAELSACFPYPLDDFQLDALRALIGQR